jgi:hypothetical protein
MCYYQSTYYQRTRGEMDIITVFGTVVGGSSPSGCTIKFTYTNI